MNTYELIHTETEEKRYIVAESPEIAIRLIAECSLPFKVTSKLTASPYDPWDYEDSITAREMSEEEVKALDPSKTERP